MIEYMPKQVANDKKQFQCEWCSKRYVHASGKSAHEKTAHNTEYKHRNMNRKTDSIGLFDIKLAKQRLQQKVFDGEIDMDEYNEVLGKMEDKVKRQHTNTLKASLDIDKVLNKDHDHMFTYLYARFKDDGIGIITDQLIDGDYSTVFMKVYRGQIRHTKSDTEDDMFEYLSDGDTKEVVVTSSLVGKLMSAVINAIFKKLNTYEDVESEIIENENIDDEDIRRIKALSTTDRTNKLMHSSSFDKAFLLRLIRTSFDKFQGELILD